MMRRVGQSSGGFPLIGLALAALAWEPTEAQAAAPPEPFKVANIHFETNASACDMGIQLIFDTEGITEGSVEAPNGKTIYSFRSKGAMRATGGAYLKTANSFSVSIPAYGSARSTSVYE